MKIKKSYLKEEELISLNYLNTTIKDLWSYSEEILISKNFELQNIEEEIEKIIKYLKSKTNDESREYKEKRYIAETAISLLSIVNVHNGINQILCNMDTLHYIFNELRIFFLIRNALDAGLYLQNHHARMGVGTRFKGKFRVDRKPSGPKEPPDEILEWDDALMKRRPDLSANGRAEIIAERLAKEMKIIRKADTIYRILKKKRGKQA